MQKKKAAAIAATILAFLFGFALWGLLLPDGEVSRAERRKLAQAPAFSAGAFFSGEYAGDLERYLLDQFPGRDGWRALLACYRFDLLRQGDSNGVYLEDGSLSRLEYPLKEGQVRYAAKKINSVIETYLQDSEVRFAVVPDKNYYLAGERPKLDYERLFAMTRELVNAPFLDLTACLTAEDYYRTDSHWRQERIFPVARAVADSLGVSLASEADFTSHELSPFYGVYCGQSALDVEPDALVYRTSAATEAAVMTGPELSGPSPVYTLERFEGMDGYDVFCAGAQSVLTIESPLAKTDRELLIFRDSFGSSLAPYFLESYRTVTLIDLRYISSGILADYVDFHGQDALFLYSPGLLNAGMLLK